MGYSHVDSQSFTRAQGLNALHGFCRRRFNLFAISQCALQSWWWGPSLEINSFVA